MADYEMFITGVSENVEFGINCKVADSVNIYGAHIGNDCFIGPWVEIQNDVIIGNNTHIHSHSLICEGMVIGNNCFIGHGVMTANSKYPTCDSGDWVCESPVIEDNVVIGSNVTILPGVKIAKNAMIGAGVTVVSDIAEGEKFIGNGRYL